MSEEQQTQTITVDSPEELPSPDELPLIRVYSRSTFFYWWPVWVTGFIMAILTWTTGETVALGEGAKATDLMIHPSRGPGIVFAFVTITVIILTNVTMRGMASVIAILSAAFLAVLFALLGWWDEILSVIPQMSLYASAGFYLFLSSILFLAWATWTFVFDKLTYWEMRPGQFTHSKVIGEAERSFDTRGMIVEKFGEDFFKHRLLGFGSGDIRIITSGARSDEIVLNNVLWVDQVIDEVQRLANINPDSLRDTED